MSHEDRHSERVPNEVLGDVALSNNLVEQIDGKILEELWELAKDHLRAEFRVSLILGYAHDDVA
eukprot:CAMPEP_0114535610 /NCGR_PEP_ID=MMETSP0109-20121206/28521_1 /TAXON_ID=29199 /ORGANISM="Chlorarachnion reptans, Strain CCCM449" /LENGTH=63 /DNA_ID=CAMNT_0001719213 /DNA_START=500 /DNA_END=691 /DNA_ORIENTATION=-